MTRTLLRSAVVLAALAAPSLALAQAAAPGMDDAVASAKNQLGVLEYCQAAGHVEANAVEVQVKLMGMLPPATDTAKVDAAYAKGQEGVISAMGTEQSLADAAKAQGADEAALCKQIGDLVVQMGAQLPG